MRKLNNQLYQATEEEAKNISKYDGNNLYVIGGEVENGQLKKAGKIVDSDGETTAETLPELIGPDGGFDLSYPEDAYLDEYPFYVTVYGFPANKTCKVKFNNNGQASYKFKAVMNKGEKFSCETQRYDEAESEYVDCMLYLTAKKDYVLDLTYNVDFWWNDTDWVEYVPKSVFEIVVEDL